MTVCTPIKGRGPSVSRILKPRELGFRRDGGGMPSALCFRGGVNLPGSNDVESEYIRSDEYESNGGGGGSG